MREFTVTEHGGKSILQSRLYGIESPFIEIVVSDCGEALFGHAIELTIPQLDELIEKLQEIRKEVK